MKASVWMSLALAMTLMAGTACDCGSSSFNCPNGDCTYNTDCNDGFACLEGCCVEREGPACTQATEATDCPGAGECCGTDGECTTDCGAACENECGRDSDCAELGDCMECVDKCCVSFACTEDADCPPDGDLPRFCGEFDAEIGCASCEYVRCETDAECVDPDFELFVVCEEDGYLPRCSNGQCVCGHPCGAPCQDPLYCCQSSRTCEPVPVACQDESCPSCEQPNPNPGGILNEQTCQLDGVDCTCEPMPALPDAFAGRFSALALGNDGVPVISAFYGLLQDASGDAYGDLVYGVAASAAADAYVDWTILDGVPTDAICAGAAAGPRAGIAEPGEEVGFDTDIVVDADTGLARISYFDATNGVLKFAAETDTGWEIHVVDADGLTGRYTSMVLDGEAKPIIAYMTLKHNLLSSVRVAWATVAAPASAADWTFYTVASATVACAPTDCSDGEACLADSGICAVLDDPANCAEGAGCGDGEVCIAGNCEDEGGEAGIDDLPPGVGLFVDLALLADGSPVLAYYDSSFGNLSLAWWDAASSAFDGPVLLVGEDGQGNDQGDLGTDVSLFVDNPANVLHLAYQDADLGDLYYGSFEGPPVCAPADRCSGDGDCGASIACLDHCCGGWLFTGAKVELVDLGARDENGDPVDPAAAVGSLHWVGNFNKLVVDAAGEVRVAYQDGSALDLVYAVRNAAGIWNLEILARKLADAQYDGAHGFFIDQILNAAGNLAHISYFKYNLRTDPWSSELELLVR